MAHPTLKLKEGATKLCQNMDVEDGVHFILKCPFYDDLRNPILQLANLHYPNFTELTDLEQLKVIF